MWTVNNHAILEFYLLFVKVKLHYNMIGCAFLAIPLLQRNLWCVSVTLYYDVV